jgi:hypothetical protein
MDAVISKLSTRSAYDDRELSDHIRTINARTKLGPDWRDEAKDLDPLCSVSRIDWLLNGTYGHGAYVHAMNIIRLCVLGKTGKRRTNGMLAAGRELTVLVTMLDCGSLTARKITEVWKAAGVDFAAVNYAAAVEIKDFLSNVDA